MPEVLYTMIPSKSYAYMLNELSNLVFLKTYSTDFNDITITFAEQNGRPLDVKVKVNLPLINRCAY